MQRNNKQEIAKDMQWKQAFAHNMYWFRMQLNRLEEKFEKAMNFKNIQFHIFKSHLLEDLITKVKQYNAHWIWKHFISRSDSRNKIMKLKNVG